MSSVDSVGTSDETPACAVPPVLLLAHRRPDTTRAVLQSIRGAKPQRLYVFCDGPAIGDVEMKRLVTATRREIDRLIDWDCEVQRWYPSTNLGLKRGVNGALDWFFSYEDAGVILEDDCLPHADFFGYCGELLSRFQDDKRVWLISGDNCRNLPVSHGDSYGFISDPLVWGWASWRDRWFGHDPSMADWKEVRKSRNLRKVFPDRFHRAQRYLDLNFHSQSTWDYPLTLTVNRQKGLCIFPEVNLISNIGHGRADAVHTTVLTPYANAETFPILPLRHPAAVDITATAQHIWVWDILRAKRFSRVWRLKKLFRKALRKFGGWNF